MNINQDMKADIILLSSYVLEVTYAFAKRI